MRSRNLFKLIIGWLLLSSLPGCKVLNKFRHIDQPIRMHAHNDYLHERPLLEALTYGYESIEIDIIRKDSSLIVSHDGHDLETKPNIVDLYIKPLKDYCQDHKLRVWLLIDLKKYDDWTLQLLHKVAESNHQFFSTRAETDQQKPLKIILSGAMPRREIADNSEYEYFFIDGRPAHLDQGFDSQVMPLISTNLSKHLNLNPQEKPDSTRYAEVVKMISQTHSQGKQFRFWNTSDNAQIWAQLKKLKVDLIGSDDLKALSEFIN